MGIPVKLFAGMHAVGTWSVLRPTHAAANQATLDLAAKKPSVIRSARMVGFALHQMFASVSEDTMERLVRKPCAGHHAKMEAPVWDCRPAPVLTGLLVLDVKQWCVAVTVETEASVHLQMSACVHQAGLDRPVRPLSAPLSV